MSNFTFTIKNHSQPLSLSLSRYVFSRVSFSAPLAEALARFTLIQIQMTLTKRRGVARGTLVTHLKTRERETKKNDHLHRLSHSVCSTVMRRVLSSLYEMILSITGIMLCLGAVSARTHLQVTKRRSMENETNDQKEDERAKLCAARH